MLPDRVSNPGPLTYESGALPIALRGPASQVSVVYIYIIEFQWLEHLLNHENMFETRVVRANEC